MARGIAQTDASITVDQCPIADGGEGTVDALVAATAGQTHTAEVVGPLGNPVDAALGMLGEIPGQPRTAVVEMAAASGLPLVPQDQRDATATTTFGTGQLIAAALDAGAQRIILGIGGSATNDGGSGAAQALGVRFYDAQDKPITQHLTGGLLASVARIDLANRDPRLASAQLLIACDVTNPLTGPDGASQIYGPQKGATPEQVQQLDANLGQFAKLIEQATGIAIANLPGSGAAGGLGGGAVGLLGGKLQRGIDLVLDAVNFAKRADGCDLCLTGEGKLDGQTLSGKAILGVAQLAKRYDVPTVALVGCAGDGAGRAKEAGLADYIVIGKGLPVAESIARADELLAAAAGRLVAKQQA